MKWLKKDLWSYFFRTLRAGWNTSWVNDEGQDRLPIKHLREDIGAGLNKAVEDENEALSGVDTLSYNVFPW